MDASTLIRTLETRIKQRKLYLHLPYGHPSTLCPDGEMWQTKNKEGEWEEWSNKPWQIEFHANGAFHRERMLICANRVGKCITEDTCVETSKGNQRLGDIYGEPDIQVASWDGEKKIHRKVIEWFSKGEKSCVRLVLINGGFIECPLDHLIHGKDGYTFVGHFLESEQIPRVSNSEADQLIHASNVQHYSKTAQDYLVRYLRGCRQYDEQPHQAEDSGQSSSPLEDDAPQHNAVSCKKDDLAHKCKDIYRDICGHLSNLGVSPRASGLFSELSPSLAYGFAGYANDNQDEAQSHDSLNPGQSILESAPHQDQVFSLDAPDLCAEGIIAYTEIGAQEVYDFTVEGTNNYFTSGIISHNSDSGGYEAAIHMTGDYPDWWEGKRFDKPVLLWTGSPTNETSRDIVQKALLGGTSSEELGTGFIPREKIVGKPKMRQAGVSDVVDTFKVRHKSGGVSTCVLKTYEQGWRKWQGTEPDVVWLDEEPEDFKIYTEALTRLLTSHGIMMVTFTPLLGQTDLVIHFQTSESEQVWLGTATWEDAPI